MAGVPRCSSSTEPILEDLWPAVGDLAAHLLTHGHAEPSLLADLPLGSLRRPCINELLAAAVTGNTRDPEGEQFRHPV